MTAPQSAWATKLAKDLVDVFREPAIWLIQKNYGAYDPLTGNVGISADRIFHCGGAVVSKLMGPHAAFNKDGFSETTDVTFWFDSTTLPVEPTTADQVWYQGNRLSVTSVDPLLESDQDLYAYKVVASLPTGATYRGSGPPPLDAGAAPIIETWQWVFGGNAPQQPDAHGRPQVQALRWGTLPTLSAASVINPLQALTATPGTVTGGTGPFTYSYQWEIALPATGGGPKVWRPIAGATGLSYTPSALDLGAEIRLVQTGTDAEVPPKSITQATAEVLVAPPALAVATVPTIAGTVQVGKTLTATPGTFTGGLAPVTLQTVWESSADGTTNWVPVPATDPSKPLELLVDASLQGLHLRVKTIATDATVPAPQQATALGVATATVAAPADVPLLAGTAPTITGSLVVGSTLTAAGGTATAGKPPITYTYRWERAAAATGPWSTITGATGNTYVLTAADAGKFLRVVAVATDANTPTPHRIDVPSAATGAVGAALAAAAAPALPTGSPVAGTAWGPATAGTFTGGLAPVAVANQWERAAAAGGPWTPITGATALTYTPVTGDVGQFLRITSTATDSSATPVIVSSSSAASAAVAAAAITCAGGAVIIRKAPADWDSTNVFCVSGTYGNPANWQASASISQGTTGYVGNGFAWNGGTPNVIQRMLPTTVLTYSQPKGVPADWREAPKGVWHNLRTGVTAHLDAFAAVFDGTETWSEGASLNPGTVGYVIAPSPAGLCTTEDAPTPATGTWTMGGGTGGSIPVWTQAGTGVQVAQWGDPTVIGLAGSQTVIWTGAGPDPWTDNGDGTWSNSQTGQEWPTNYGTGAPTTGRPQPADTATIPRPAVSIPLFDGTPVPGYNPWVQLPRVSPVSWWNYAERREVHSPTQPTFSLWARKPGTTGGGSDWYRQTDGVHLVQTTRPDTPIDTAADWWEQPTGVWRSLLRSQLYRQTGNPGLVGDEIAPEVVTPSGVPGDWTKAGTGTAGTVWSNAATFSSVQQLGNPGITGVVGTLVVNLHSTAGITASGNLRVGAVLTATRGTAAGGITPVTDALQWETSTDGGATWRPITGATGLTYTIQAGDLGNRLRVSETFTDSTTPTAATVTISSGALGPVTAAAVPLAAGAVPQLTGTPSVGQALTVVAGSTTGGVGTVTGVYALERQPKGGGAWVPAGTIAAGGSYTLVAGDKGYTFRVVETVTDSDTPPQQVVMNSTPVGPVVVAITAPGTITITPAGAPTVGGALIAARQTDPTGGTAPWSITTFQWQVGAAAGGPWTNLATGASYTPVAGDAGKFLQVVATFTDADGQTSTATAAASGAVAAAVAYTTDPNGDHHGDGSPTDWTATLTTVGRPAGRTSGRRWHNSVTGADLWQIDNPGIPAPGVWDATQAGFYQAPAAPGGQFTAGGFIWRAPGGTAAWHWDATHSAWTDGTNWISQQAASSGVNPGTVPTAADTGPFQLNGVHYGETSAPPTITWVQTSTGVWQKMVNGRPSGPPLTQATDPTKMPP